MPTIDDLTELLGEREAFAPDRESVLRLAAAHPSRIRAVTPILAAAAVVGLAGAALVATRDAPAPAPGPGGGVPSASSSPFTGSAPPASTAPPQQSTALTWGFRVDDGTGYRATRLTFDPSAQVARLDKGTTFAGFVTMYSYGVQPKTLQLSRDATLVTVNGHGGYFFAGTTPDTTDPADHPDSWPRLLFRYDNQAWAEVAGPFGFDRSTHEYDEPSARATELELARAVHIGPDSLITMPFALHGLPSGFRVEATGSGTQDCIGYGTGDAYTATDPIGTVLTACRAPARVAGLLAPPGARVVQRDLGDGTSLVLILDTAHLDALTLARLQAIADDADLSPSVDTPSTWLPVGD